MDMKKESRKINFIVVDMNLKHSILYNIVVMCTAEGYLNFLLFPQTVYKSFKTDT